MRLVIALIIALVGAAQLGWISHELYTLTNTQMIPEITGLSTASAKEVPLDRIQEQQIRVLNDKIEILVPNAKWATLSDTHSMEPLLFKGANALQVVPQTSQEIQVGDIISYESPDARVIIHRVITIGTDEQGWFAILKGDNNPSPDGERIRFSQVRKILIGVIY